MASTHGQVRSELAVARRAVDDGARRHGQAPTNEGDPMLVVDPAAREYLATLAVQSRDILERDLIGVYAAGSLALEGYQPGRSDIDVAVVVSGPLSAPAKQALVDGLRHETVPCPARGLELVAYRTEVAAAGAGEPGFEVELNSGAAMPFRVTWTGQARREEDGRFWYGIDRSILAERGLTVYGPAAATIFRPVPDEQLVNLLIDSLRWHLAQPDADRDVDAVPGPAWTDDAVLNACRALQRLRSGHWSSKVGAGQQLVWDDPDPAVRDVVSRAIAAREGGAHPSARDARLFQRNVLLALERVAGRPAADR